jgi:cytochrome c biogenesis protein
MTSLGLAIVLFVFLALYSIIGTLLPQSMPADFYAQRYANMGGVIVALQFDRVYSSLVFRVLLLLFIVNLVGCTVKILPAQLRRMRDGYLPVPRPDSEDHFREGLNVDSLKALIRAKRFRIIETEQGFHAVKHRLGHVGSSVTHLGIVIIMLGSFFGNWFAQEGFVNMLPGDVRGFPSSGFSLRLDDFSMSFREDGSIEQYYSDLVVLESGQEVVSKTIWVNNPLKHNRIDFYQTSWGWANQLEIRNANGDVVSTKLMRGGESHFYQPEHLTVYLYGFFPDMVVTQSGEPMSMTQRRNNPYYAVVLYHFNDHVGSFIVEPGQAIPYADLNIIFPDSILFTGITWRQDMGYPFVLLGSFFMMLGLMLAFYAYPKYVVFDGSSLKVASQQNVWGMNYQLRRIVSDSSKGQGD